MNIPSYVLLENISGEHTVTVVSVCLSSCILNLSSEIDVVDNKCSLRQGIVGQSLSWSFFKVQGQKAFNKESNFFIQMY
jgi:hypothetical protein